CGWRTDLVVVEKLNPRPVGRELAAEAERVEWGGESCIRKAVEALEQGGARPDRVGIIGPMTFEQHAVLAARFGKAVSLNRAYARLRMVKSPDEISWLRIGAALSDR